MTRHKKGLKAQGPQHRAAKAATTGGFGSYIGRLVVGWATDWWTEGVISVQLDGNLLPGHSQTAISRCGDHSLTSSPFLLGGQCDVAYYLFVVNSSHASVV